MNNKSQNLMDKYRDKIERFCLMDDTFMSKVFEDKACSELLIEVILEKKLNVYDIKTQYAVSNLQGRSARLDIWATDDTGKIYNIEVQNENEDAVPKRARYNSSLIDANILEKSSHWSNLPETYVIFITRNDVLGGNKPIYHIERTVREMDGKAFGDESNIVYVNSKIQDETALGRLMHDFYCTKAEDMYNAELSERVSYWKDEKKGGGNMCAILEEVTKEANVEKDLSFIKLLMTKNNLSVAEAMSFLDIPKTEQPMYLKKLGLC